MNEWGKHKSFIEESGDIGMNMEVMNLLKHFD